MSRDSGDAVDRILHPDTALRLLDESKGRPAGGQASAGGMTADGKDTEGVDEGAGANDASAEPSQEELEASLPTLQEGAIVKGTVVEVTNDGVLVDVGTKYEGIIPLYEFPSPAELPQVNDELSVAIVRVDDEEGQVLLSKKRADYENCWNRIISAMQTGEILTAMVTERVKGGLRVDLGMQGFVPASHVGARRLRDLDRLVGRSLRVRVIEADREQKKVILSHRVVVEEEREKRKAETMERLREGAVFEGRVRSLTNYGAFVDLGGVDGLLHISEMSWTRISHPSEVLKVGDTIQVMVLKIDRQRERISLGLRQILPDPWKEAARQLRIGQIVRGRVTRVVPFGAFVQLDESGIEGIIPNAELTEKRGTDAKDVVHVNQAVDVKVLNVRLEERRMTLSLTQAQQEAERREYQDYIRTQQSQRPTIGDVAGDILAQHRANLVAAEQGAQRKRAPRAPRAPRAEEPEEPTEPEQPAEPEAPEALSTADEVAARGEDETPPQAETPSATEPQAEAEAPEPVAEAPQTAAPEDEGGATPEPDTGTSEPPEQSDEAPSETEPEKGPDD